MRQLRGRALRSRLWALLALVLLVGSLWPGTPFTSTAYAADTGFLSPSAQAADTGGDNDGFELNPTNAFADDAAFASNIDGDDDRHLFYDYSLTVPTGAAVNGIEVQLDWWLDAVNGNNSMRVELSWDGGTSWTGSMPDTVESTTEHTTVLGGSTDLWGRVSWTPAEFSDTNFRLRLTSRCQGSGTNCNPRDYFLDWVAVKVYFTPATFTSACGGGSGGNISIDGAFSDWDGKANTTDTDDAFGSDDYLDLATLCYANTENVSRQFWAVERYIAGFTGSYATAYYRITVDTNDNGTFTETVDRDVRITHDPNASSSVSLFDGAGTPLTCADCVVGGETAGAGGLRVEVGVGLSDLDISSVPHTIRFFADSRTAGASVVDRVPDTGDIQWSAVSVLGWALTIGLLVAAVGAIWYFRGRHVWKGH